MIKKTYQIMAGILGLILVITLSSGATIYLKETDKYTNCRAEWLEQENGQSLCPKTNETEWCYRIEYRGAGWHRCWIGEPVEPIEPEIIQTPMIENRKSNSGDIHCTYEGCV